MNLLFRMCWVVIAALLGRRLDPMATSTVTFRVWPLDLDLNFHMNNGRYLTMMDLGRIDLMLRTGMAGVLWRHRWHPVLGGATVRFRRPLAPFARFRQHTRTVCWDDKWIYLEQIFETMDGKVAAHALMRAVFLDKNHQVVPNDQLMHELGRDQPSPPFPPAVMAWQATDQAMTTAA